MSAATRRDELAELVAPGHTALVTVELQDNVVGDHAVIPDLAAAAAQVLPRVGALVAAARGAGVQVVHCTVDTRDDGRGANHNTPLLAAFARRNAEAEATDGRRGGQSHQRRVAAVHPAVGATDADLVMARLHGMSPMTGTSLDPVLRNLGVTTVVAVGVSVNVAVLGFCFEAVNLGYRVVVPRDGVAGVDDAYVDAVFANTLRMLATITTTDQLLDAWEAAP